MASHSLHNSRSTSLKNDIAAAGLGPLFAQGFALALFPVLFRLYTPADFGIWATAQAVAFAAGSLATLRFDLALVTERDPAAACQLFFAIAGIIVAWFTIIGIFLAGSLLLFDLSFHRSSLFVAWLWSVLIALSSLMQSWMVRDGAFGDVSFSVAFGAVVANTAQIIGGIFGGPIWLIIGSLMGQATSLCYCAWRILRSRHRPRWTNLTFYAIWALLEKHQRFFQFSMPFTALSLLRERAPTLIVAALLPPNLVGAYSQAWRLMHVPSGLTSGALRPVFFHRAASHGLNRESTTITGITNYLLLGASPWIGLLLFAHDPLFELVLGPPWKEASLFAAVLAVPAALFVATNWMDRLLDVAGRQDLNLKAELIVGLASCCALGGTLALGGSLFLATLLQSAALALVYVGFLWACYGAIGWSRSSLVLSILTASAAVAAVYMLLLALSALLSTLAVVVLGVGVAVLATLVVVTLAIRRLR